MSDLKGEFSPDALAAAPADARGGAGPADGARGAAYGADAAAAALDQQPPEFGAGAAAYAVQPEAGTLFFAAVVIMALAGFARDVELGASACRTLAGDAELLRAVGGLAGPRGKTRLIYAAAMGDLERVRALMAAEVDIDAFRTLPGYGRLLAVQVAGYEGRMDTLAELLYAGADLAAQTRSLKRVRRLSLLHLL